MKYYNLGKIDKCKTAYRLIIGKRSNGKTYAVIHKGIEEFLKTGKKFAYIRRYRDDITAPNLSQLLDPHNVEEMSTGQWDGVDYRSRQFYFTYTEDGKKYKSDPVCDTFALNTWERSKGADRGEYSLIIFDEFITRDQYLKDEVNIFLNVISSLMRNRTGTPIYMIANTVSQFCPYFADFGINPAELEQGKIYTPRDNVAIEYCADNGAATADYFRGFKQSKISMITRGAWEIRDYARLENSYKNYNFVLRFFIEFRDRTICGEMREGNGHLFLYFYPFTGEIKDRENTIIYSPKTSGNVLHGKDIKYQPTSAHKLIAELITNDKVFYSDNMTGEGVRAFIQGVSA